jgi:hypothetical protein
VKLVGELCLPHHTGTLQLWKYRISEYGSPTISPPLQSGYGNNALQKLKLSFQTFLE